MELTALRYFVAAGEHRTLSEAALSIPISQPAMSAAIRRLEDEFGVRLLNRSRGRGSLQLTPAGERVLRGARRVLSDAERIVEDLGRWKRVEHGTLRIAAGTAALEYFLPRPVARTARSYPGLQIALHEDRSARVLEQLRAGDLDVGVVTGPADAQDLRDVPWLSDPLVCVGPPDLSPAHSQTAAEVFARHRLISYGESDLQDQIDEALEGVGIERRPDRLIIRSGEAMKQYISAGLGIGLLSRRTVRIALQEERLSEIPLSDLEIIRRYDLVFRNEPNPAAEAFRVIALEELDRE